MTDIVTVAWKKYLYSLQTKPLATKAITAGTLSALADLVSQTVAGTGSIKWRRTILLALYGTIYSGPCAHYWQIALEKLFPNKDDPLRVYKKVLVDQLVYSPFQNLVVLSYLAKVVDSLPLDIAFSKVSLQFPTVQAMGWRFWPLASYINQQYLPIQLRVLWMNVIAFLWGVFIMIKSRASAPVVVAAKRA